MNVVLPVDFQSFVPVQNAIGTVEARLDNNAKQGIQPPQANTNAQQTRQQDSKDQLSREPSKDSIKESKDKVSLSSEGKQAAKSSNTNELSAEDQDKVEALKDRDREVRIHEQAHAAVGGQYAGSPSYDYETGPDNKRYAVGGEVSIDVGEESTPEDTIQKMQVVRAAALAPAEPSTQDLKVAAQATQTEQQARAELSQQALNHGDSDKAVDESTTTKNDQQNESANVKQQSKLAMTYQAISADNPLSSFSTSA